VLTGENRTELEKVLTHYSRTADDSLKLWAAVFLIENMRWHYYQEFAQVWRFFQKPAGLELYSPLKTRKHLCPMNKNDRHATIYDKKKRKIRIEERKKEKTTGLLFEKARQEAGQLE
jgi:hypothetical protein